MGLISLMLSSATGVSVFSGVRLSNNMAQCSAFYIISSAANLSNISISGNSFKGNLINLQEVSMAMSDVDISDNDIEPRNSYALGISRSTSILVNVSFEPNKNLQNLCQVCCDARTAITSH